MDRRHAEPRAGAWGVDRRSGAVASAWAVPGHIIVDHLHHPAHLPPV